MDKSSSRLHGEDITHLPPNLKELLPPFLVRNLMFADYAHISPVMYHVCRNRSPFDEEVNLTPGFCASKIRRS